MTNDLGSRAPLLRDLPRDALHRDRPPLVRRRRARPLPRRRVRRLPRRSRTSPSGSRSGSHPWTAHEGLLPARRARWRSARTARATSSCKSLYSIANGGFGGTGLGKGTFATRGGHQLIPYVNTDFIYSALAQELGLVGAAALLLVYMVFVAARLEDRAPGRRRLLEAARGRAHVRLRAADVRHRRRDPAADPADRDHAARSSPTAARRIVANFLLLAGLMLVSHRANASAS